MTNLCTLFDSNYLSRGLTMYESLKQLGVDFRLFIFAFDQTTVDYLRGKHLDHMEVIALSEFEDEELLRIKNDRSSAEYCWTCTPSIILHALERYELPSCTYVDADLYFYADPKILLDELGDQSVSIISHRYTPAYDQAAISGTYCVQFMTFKNNESGLEVLRWWRDACIDWCYARAEDGKFGDQKYLDEWPIMFPEAVKVLKHLGGGVAPWNVQQYTFEEKDGRIVGLETATGTRFEMVFFHFHFVKIYQNGVTWISEYEKSNEVLELFYRPYLRHLFQVGEALQKELPEVNYHAMAQKSPKPVRGLMARLALYKEDFIEAVKLLVAWRLKKKYANYHFFRTSDLLDEQEKSLL